MNPAQDVLDTTYINGFNNVCPNLLVATKPICVVWPTITNGSVVVGRVAAFVFKPRILYGERKPSQRLG